MFHLEEYFQESILDFQVLITRAKFMITRAIQEHFQGIQGKNY